MEEKKRPLFSLVMPVYNTAKYLNTALNSVREQTFGDWELILVDDASDDGSGALCEDAARGDARIRVLRLLKNSGASAARNAGMDAASGTYLLFIDSDDELERDLLARLDAVPRADVTVWGVWDEYLNEQERCYKRAAHVPVEGFYRGTQQVRSVLIDLEADTLLGYIWNKCYRLDSVRQSGVRFEDRLVTEDIFFNLRQCEAWQSLYALPAALLHYRHRQTHMSITGRFVPDYFAQNRERVEAILTLYDRWNATDAHVLTQLGNIYARYVFSALERLYDPRAGASRPARRAFLRARFSQEDELFARVIPHAAPNGFLPRVMAAALKRRSVPLCLLIGHSVHIAKERLPGLFTRLRQSR